MQENERVKAERYMASLVSNYQERLKFAQLLTHPFPTCNMLTLPWLLREIFLPSMLTTPVRAGACKTALHSCLPSIGSTYFYVLVKYSDVALHIACLAMDRPGEQLVDTYLVPPRRTHHRCGCNSDG